MSRLPFAEHCAARWHTLLAENSVLDQEHVDLVSSLKPPFSRKQIAQLDTCAAQCLWTNGPKPRRVD